MGCGWWFRLVVRVGLVRVGLRTATLVTAALSLLVLSGACAPLPIGIAPSTFRVAVTEPSASELLVSGFARAWRSVCTDAQCPGRCCNRCQVSLALSDVAGGADFEPASDFVRLHGFSRVVKECELHLLPLVPGKRYLVGGTVLREEAQGPLLFQPARWRLDEGQGGPWVSAEKPYQEPQASSSVSDASAEAQNVEGPLVVKVKELVRAPASYAGKEITIEGFAQPCGARRCTKARCRPLACCNRCTSQLGLVDELDPRADCFHAPTPGYSNGEPHAVPLVGTCTGTNCALVCEPLQTGARYRVVGRWAPATGKALGEYTLQVTRTDLLAAP